MCWPNPLNFFRNLLYSSVCVAHVWEASSMKHPMCSYLLNLVSIKICELNGIYIWYPYISTKYCGALASFQVFALCCDLLFVLLPTLSHLLLTAPLMLIDCQSCHQNKEENFLKMFTSFLLIFLSDFQFLVSSFKPDISLYHQTSI